MYTMTIKELLDTLVGVPEGATVYISTPCPTEMRDCELTSVSLEGDNDGNIWNVWLHWATENCGSGETPNKEEAL